MNRFEGLLSTAEAAEIWAIDQSTIRKAIANGDLKEGQECKRFGKQWIITVEAMERWTGTPKSLRDFWAPP